MKFLNFITVYKSFRPPTFYVDLYCILHFEKSVINRCVYYEFPDNSSARNIFAIYIKVKKLLTYIKNIKRNYIWEWAGSSNQLITRQSRQGTLLKDFSSVFFLSWRVSHLNICSIHREGKEWNETSDQRPNSWTKSRQKSYVFPPCYSQLPL